MKTCHLSASSFAVSPLQFLSSAGGLAFCELLAYFDVEEIYLANLKKKKSLKTLPDKNVFTITIEINN